MVSIPTSADSGALRLGRGPVRRALSARIGRIVGNRAGFQEVAGSRLPGVDGLRAVAALWVVFFHMQAFSHARFHYIPGLDLFLRSGSIGVSLFLVLSGFCLYIPFAGGKTHRFRTRDFLLRRCRRLLPAYYTSLAFVLAINLGVGVFLGFHALSPGEAFQQAAAHITLVHTLFPSTFYALNGAYWSLGLEWQLYLTLPLLICGIRKFGMTRTIMSVVACNIVYGLALGLMIRHGTIAHNGVLATVVLPNELPGRWSEFAFGMVAAELHATGRIRQLIPRGKGKAAVLMLAPLFLMISLWPGVHGLVIGAGRHIAYGAAFFVLLSLVLASNNIVSKLASWTPLVMLGTMSYSLYLVHQPIVQGLAYFTRVHAHTSPQFTFLALLALLPLIMLVAWILFFTVERRTLNSKRPASSAGTVVGVVATE